MNILDKIIDYKRKEVGERKQLVSESLLRENDLFKRPVFSLKEFLLDEGKTGIIAEFKRRSPSKGIINDQVDVAEITAGYTRFGASGLSVLTDEAFFGGSKEDLVKARENLIPILRKDFIIDEYQIVEARAMGADVILLIAACLSPEEVKNLAAFARNLDLEVLLELHGEEELDHICDETELIGINNRDLKTFAVDSIILCSLDLPSILISLLKCASVRSPKICLWKPESNYPKLLPIVLLTFYLLPT